MHGKNSEYSKNPNPKSSILDRMTMSFFITNLPPNLAAKDLWKRCLDWGVVTDVFIPNRLSKMGKRFGFVRFIKVGNAEKLLSDLRSMWFGNYKVFADVERFGRKGNSYEPSSKQAQGVEERPGYQPVNDFNMGKKSFAEALVKGTGNASVPIKRVVKVTNVVNDSLDQDSRSLLVKLKDPVSVPYSRKWLFEEGFIDTEITYVGGRWISIVFSNVDARETFLSNDALKCKYVATKLPCGSFVPDERMVWVEISGVPKGAWNNDNFQLILGSWGKGVFFVSDWKSACSLGKVCVLTQSSKFIFEEMSIEFNNKKYEIWMREFAVWEPKVVAISYGCYDDGSKDSDCASFGSKADFESEDEKSEGFDTFATDEDGKVGPFQSVSFDSKLCKVNSDCSEGGDNQGGHQPSVKEVANAGSGEGNVQPVEYVDQAINDDIFSLDRIIEKDGEKRKRATSCPPMRESKSDSVSSGAPGFKKGMFPAMGVHTADGGGDSQFDSHFHSSGFCASQGSTNSVDKVKEILETGKNMGFEFNGDLKEVEKVVIRVSAESSFQ